MKTLKSLHRNFSLIILIVLLFSSFHFSIKGQSNKQIGLNPVMKISNFNRGTESPMRLDILKIDIKVIGQVAVTTLDMTYFNPNSRAMEGEFSFPLGDGQTVSRFALDINGTLREGVVVEKEQGRKTFEAIVRRGIDPGLLEMTEGNNFRMRVFPLPAKGTRRVVMAFEQELTDKGSNDLYLLPLKISESVAKFSIHAEIIKNEVRLDTVNNEFNNLSFNKWNDSYITNFEQDNYKPDKQFALTFPHINGSERTFTSLKNSHSDSSYFFINIRPKEFEEAKSLPKRITLFWDHSNSAQDQNIEKELKLLDTYIQKIGYLSIELVPFNIQTGKRETFEITNGNWDKLKTALKAIEYDGGTSMGNLDFTKFKSNEILLVTDGMSNFGTVEPKFSNTPVYTINSNNTANHAFLTSIAQRSGGVYINLSKLTNEEAVTLLTTSNYHFISAKTESGKVSDIYPSMPCQFNQSFSLAGIMTGKSATITLNFGFGNTRVYSKTIKIDTANSQDPFIIRRLWAEKKIAELSVNAEKNKVDILETGKEYGIVTPNTSLIVLENLNDYLANNIVPPKEMWADYFIQKQSINKSRSENTINHIDQVVTLSDEQSKWWNTDFPLLAEKQVKSKIKFTAPVIAPDEETIKTQEELTRTDVNISVSDVRGTDEANGMDVSELNKMVVGEDPEPIKNGQVEKNEVDIQLNAWDPQTPYLKVLQYAQSGGEYPTYLKLKKEYGSTPAFYIDASDFFSKLGKKDTAVTILSNLAELKLESPQLLRILGNKLIELKRTSEAVMVFEKILTLKGEEPQSYRDLGLAYEANGEFEQAIQTLYKVVEKVWDDRFPGIELIVMNEINSIINQHPELNYTFIDKRLIKKEPVSIRVNLTWDTDNCDMDLWVTDPSGEKCFFSHKLTTQGGKNSNDFTRGYGPEEFMLKKGLTGQYLVQVNYYGTHSQAILAPVNLHLVFFTNFGKPAQKKQEVSLRLEDQQDVIDVGKFNFKAN